jgi:copper chaperone CopZ
MKITPSMGLLAMLLVYSPGCGSSDEADPASTTATERAEPIIIRVENTAPARAVVTLKISGMADESDAEEVQGDLAGVRQVERVTVDFKSGSARILMQAGFDPDDIADAAEKLRDALSKPFVVTATGFDEASSASSEFELKW